MQVRFASIVAFFREDGKILIQDRRNILKDDIEWSFFGGGREEGESFEGCAIREIQEEINISLQITDLREIGHTLVEFGGTIRTEIHLFVTPWKESYHETFQVLEGAGSAWVTLTQMRNLSIYSINHTHISILERYFFLNA